MFLFEKCYLICLCLLRETPLSFQRLRAMEKLISDIIQYGRAKRENIHIICYILFGEIFVTAVLTALQHILFIPNIYIKQRDN